MAYNIFDPREYQRLTDSKDYLGMANYLEAHPVKDGYRQNMINRQIDDLREQAGIKNKILENNPQMADLFSFREDLVNNKIDRNNSYGKQFADLWDDLGKENDDDISTTFTLRLGKTNLDRFLTYFGSQNLSNSGMTLGTEGGLYSVTVDKSKVNKFQFLSAISKVSTDNFYDYSNAYNGQVAANFAANPNDHENTVPLDNTGLSTFSVKGDIGFWRSMAGFTNTKNHDRLNDILTLFNRSGNNFDELMQNATNRNAYTQTVQTPFLGAANQKLIELLQTGELDIQTYNAYAKIQKEQYDRLLAQVPLSQVQVYTTGVDGNESEALTLLEDNKAKGELSEIVRVALQENRITYASANSGGLTGVMITIAPKPNTEGQIKGEYNKGRQLFIPGLWQDKAEEDLAADTSIRAQRVMNTHQLYNHDYNGVRGDILKNFTQDGAIYKDYDNNERFVSFEDALNIMDEDMMIKDIVSVINVNYRNRDGLLENKETIDTYVKTACLKEVNSLYPNMVDEYRSARFNSLYNAIMYKLGFDSE